MKVLDVSPLQCLIKFLANICSMMEIAFVSEDTFSTCSISQRTASADTKVVRGRGAFLVMKERPGDMGQVTGDREYEVPVVEFVIASSISLMEQELRRSLKSF